MSLPQVGAKIPVYKFASEASVSTVGVGLKHVRYVVYPKMSIYVKSERCIPNIQYVCIDV